MSTNIFISYSRRETGFVNQLANSLGKKGYDYWLDYRSLVPGRPWKEQIMQGVADADVILIVVSEASMGSEYVHAEWVDEVGATDKRIVLALFESTPLNEDLRGLPWADFRKNYKAGLKQVQAIINTPPAHTTPVPESGFTRPTIVWVTFALSVFVAILSLVFGFWTIAIPWTLVPLPFRILKRNYEYTQTQISLSIMIFLPLLTGFMVPFFYSTDISQWLADLLKVGFFLIFPGVSIMTLFLLRLRGMQRWAKPSGLRSFSARLLKIRKPSPTRSVAFWIDHAPEDARVANVLQKALTKYGHRPAASQPASEVHFALLSAYKTDSDVDTDVHVVIPVILQMRDNFSERMSRMQWIDFRRGIRNLKGMAHYLPEPEKLLKTLGTVPSGNQTVTPLVVQAYSLWLKSILASGIGGWILFYLLLKDEVVLSNGPVLRISWFLMIWGLLIYFCVRVIQELNQRKTRRGQLGVLFFSLGFIGVLVVAQMFFGDYITVLVETLPENDYRPIAPLYVVVAYVLGGILVTLISVWKWQDLRNWLPTAPKKKR